MKVEQLINDKGNGAMNLVISGDGKLIFQSYDSIQSYDSMIAEINYNTNTITIGEDWDYSVTTSKHRNIFFRDYAKMPELATKDGLKKAIKDGVCNNFKVVLQCS